MFESYFKTVVVFLHILLSLLLDACIQDHVFLVIIRRAMTISEFWNEDQPANWELRILDRHSNRITADVLIIRHLWTRPQDTLLKFLHLGQEYSTHPERTNYFSPIMELGTWPSAAFSKISLEIQSTSFRKLLSSRTWRLLQYKKNKHILKTWF